MLRGERFIPASEQLRTEIGGFDLEPERTTELAGKLKEFGLHELLPPIPGYYATIYFLTSNNYPLSKKVRFRIYGLTEEMAADFKVNPEDLGVLEIKSKPQEYPTRIEHKIRQTCTADLADQVTRFPGAAFQIMSTNLPGEIPKGYPTGRIPPEVFTELITSSLFSSGNLIPSLCLISRRSHFVLDLNNPDTFRVSLDANTSFHGYDPHHPAGMFGTIHNISAYPFTRAEVKVVGNQPQELSDKILQLLSQIGHRPPVRGTGFQSYFRYFYGAAARNALQPIYKTNEIPEVEAEAKINIISTASVDQIASSIYKAILTSSTQFTIQPNPPFLRSIRESNTHTIRYGVNKEGTLREAFVITVRPEDSWVGIKRKDGQEIQDWILFRKETRETLQNWPQWTPWAEETVVEQESQRLEVTPEEIVKVGEMDRRKLRVYAQRFDTSRLYIVSVDESITEDGKKLRQIEVEYGGRLGIHPAIDAAKAQIKQDIEELRKLVKKVCQKEGIELEETLMTKFDFLISSQGTTS